MSIQILSQAQPGFLTSSQKSGGPAAVITGWQNEQLVSEVMPRFFYPSVSGLVFGATWASAATAAASATALGAFGLINFSTNRNLVILDATVAQTAYTAAAAYLACGWQVVSPQPISTYTAGNAPVNLFSGNPAASIAKTVIAATTVGASTVVSRIASASWTDLVANDVQSIYKDQIDGAIIIPPLGAIGLVSISGTPTVIMGMTWAEMPV